MMKIILDMMKIIMTLIGTLIGIVMLIIGISALLALPVMWLWNYVVPYQLKYILGNAKKNKVSV